MRLCDRSVRLPDDSGSVVGLAVSHVATQRWSAPLVGEVPQHPVQVPGGLQRPQRLGQPVEQFLLAQAVQLLDLSSRQLSPQGPVVPLA